VLRRDRRAVGTVGLDVSSSHWQNLRLEGLPTQGQYRDNFRAAATIHSFPTGFTLTGLGLFRQRNGNSQSTYLGQEYREKWAKKRQHELKRISGPELLSLSHFQGRRPMRHLSKLSSLQIKHVFFLTIDMKLAIQKGSKTFVITIHVSWTRVP
jgi:hypothetical protein